MSLRAVSCRLPLAALIAAFLAGPGSAAVRDASGETPLEETLARLPARTWIRVHSPQGMSQGRVSALGSGSVSLDDGERVRVVDLDSIEEVWVKDRSFWPGFLIGGGIGGAAGIGFGVIVTALCSIEGDGCPVAIPIGFGIGALGGSMVGGLAGAAPRWRPVHGTQFPVDPGDIKLVPTTGRGYIGNLVARLGYGHPTSGGAPGGFALLGGFYVDVGTLLSFGPEFGYTWLGENRESTRALLTARFSAGGHPLRPYVLAGAGPSWRTIRRDSRDNTNLYLGADLGAGVTYDLPRPFEAVLEGRYHVVSATGGSFVTGTAGVSLGW